MSEWWVNLMTHKLLKRIDSDLQKLESARSIGAFKLVTYKKS